MKGFGEISSKSNPSPSLKNETRLKKKKKNSQCQLVNISIPALLSPNPNTLMSILVLKEEYSIFKGRVGTIMLKLSSNHFLFGCQ